MADIGSQVSEQTGRSVGYALTLSGGLASTPFWVDWLSSINIILTTATLATGLILGVAQIVSLFRGKKS